MAEISRLSPYNIKEDLIRVELYREIRKGEDDWYLYEIQVDEVLRPELIAYRVYGTDLLKWVILISAGLDDMREPLKAGELIKLPPLAWIRQRIKFYSKE
ncbi:MAG: hypothetical protein HQK79_20705 [Desulfobacterales bacterium]|nr:hypothetical protein [Desulfobacterales bacterium]